MRTKTTMRTACLGLALMFGLANPGGRALGDWWVNIDVNHVDITGRQRPATDFDFKVVGDMTQAITQNINAFPDPQMDVEFNGTNSRVRMSSKTGATIASNPDPNVKHHFGFDGPGPKPRIFEKTWTYANNPIAVRVPDPNMDFAFFPATGDLVITAVNLTPDVIVFSDAGYLKVGSPYALADLNRTVLPGSTFLPLPALDGTYAPGDAHSVVLSGFAATDFVVTYGEVAFPGPSDFSGAEWTQVGVADQAVPGPATAVLLAWGATCALAARVSRRTARGGDSAGAA